MMKFLLGYVALTGVNGQCGAVPVTCGASGCVSCATCTSPSCFQSCCSAPAPPVVPAPPPPPPPAIPVYRPTCSGYDCGRGWQRTKYIGECPGGSCHREMCCARLEDCSRKNCPAGWHKKQNPSCEDGCQTEDCCEQERSCRDHSCARGTRIHAAYPCPVQGCTDELCCDDHIIDVNCQDWFNHHKCKKHWASLPVKTRCRHETCTHDECCQPEKPPDCSTVTCPSHMLHVKPNDRVCGRWSCATEDCCHELRSCDKVECPMFHKKVKTGSCEQKKEGSWISAFDQKDCHWKDCCQPEATCVDFDCGSTAIKTNGGVCRGDCDFGQCCEATTTTTTCAPPPPPPVVVVQPTCIPNTCGCR